MVLHHIVRIIGVLAVISSIFIGVICYVLARLTRTVTGKAWIMRRLWILNPTDPLEVFDNMLSRNRLMVNIALLFNPELLDDLYTYLGMPVNPRLLSVCEKSFVFDYDATGQSAAASTRIKCLVHNAANRHLRDLYGYYYDFQRYQYCPPGALAEIAYISLYCKKQGIKTLYKGLYDELMGRLREWRQAALKVEQLTAKGKTLDTV